LKEKAYRLFQRKLRCALEIYKFWRRNKLRKCAYQLLYIGREIIRERARAEEREILAYRLRVAQRRIHEYEEFRDWKEEKKIVIKKQIKDFKKQRLDQDKRLELSLSPLPSPRAPSPSPVRDRKSPAKGRKETREEKIIEEVDVPDEEIRNPIVVPLTADEELLSSDPRHTRPDLAPFSTRINSMIYDYIQKPFTSSSTVRVSSIIPCPKPTPNFLGEEPQFSTILSSQLKSWKRQINHNPSETMPLDSAYKPIEYPLNSSPFQSKSRTYTYRDSQDSYYGNSNLISIVNENYKSSFLSIPFTPHPPSSSKHGSIQWEVLADVSKIPSIQAMKAEKELKSPAFKALEKLSNLTESDIKRVRKEVRDKEIIAEIIRQRRKRDKSHLIYL
jgi:hypothetical protein